MALPARACQDSDRELWSCDLSIPAPQAIDASRPHNPGTVTDAYLLALAVVRDGRYASRSSIVRHMTFPEGPRWRSRPSSGWPPAGARPGPGARTIALYRAMLRAHSCRSWGRSASRR